MNGFRRIACLMAVVLIPAGALAEDCQARSHAAADALAQQNLVQSADLDAARSVIEQALCAAPEETGQAEEAEEGERAFGLDIKPAERNSKGHQRLKRKQ